MVAPWGEHAIVRQTTRSAVLEVQPESTAVLRTLIDTMRTQQEAFTPAYDGLHGAVPCLHFMSMTVFEDGQYDPILVIEVNFDGEPGPFWGQIEAALREPLRDMLRCGKTPRDGNAALFASVTAPGSRAPMAPLLEALSLVPAVAHQGNRGLDRSRIEGEGSLFAAVQDALDAMPADPHATQQSIHQALRASLLPRFDWLASPPPPRIPADESRADYARLAGFAVLALLVLLLPGAALSLVVRPFACFLSLVAAGVVFQRLLPAGERPSLSPQAIGLIPLVAVVLIAFAAVFTAASALAGSIHHWHVTHFWRHFRLCAVPWSLGVVGIFPAIYGLLAWVRFVERRDPPQDAPPRDEAMLRAMARREDRISQNHMGSVVHIKPGVLRAVILRVALHALGLVLRVQARNGYLGSMRTIHFAHWALASNGQRLMFFSNFDGSWESYLDDFIEKAHAGLTLAWTGCVGFPATRFLVLDGATQGRRFKAWARHSMAESLFWFSAYKDFSVNQIERQACVADGLRKPSLTETEAEAWALFL